MQFPNCHFTNLLLYSKPPTRICATVPQNTPLDMCYSVLPPTPFRYMKCATVSTFRTAPPKKLKKWGQLFVIGVVCPNPPHPLHTHNKKTLWAHPLPSSQVGGLHPRLPTLSPYIHRTPSLPPLPPPPNNTNHLPKVA